MKELGYYNGKIGELNEMTVPMNDRACWFGDGVYEAAMVRNGHYFALDEHVDRLFRSAAKLGIAVPMDKEALKTLLNDLVKQMDTGNLMAYWQVTRGSGPRGHAFPDGPANLWVTLRPKEINPGSELISLITDEDIRFLHCDIKTLNLIPSVMAAEKAKQAGCYECVLYRPGGRVTECSHSNVHIIETPFTVDELMAADEIIVSSSTAPCNRACKVNGQAVGMKRGDLFEALHKAVFDEYYSVTE